MGLIEMPQGGQVLVRMGSTVDGGKVTEISARHVRLSFPDHSVDLALAGAPGDPSARASLHSAAAGLPTISRGTHGHPRMPDDNVVPPAETRLVPPATLNLLLVNGVPAAPSHTDAGRFVAEQVSPMFGLPDNSRLLSVNDTPVTSAGQAVASLQGALRNGVAVLGVDTPDGPRRIYVSPSRVPGR
ncbi:MAG: hypothetical protein JSR67_11145 [Proteobacteria bacterium]|nr:hypothetical protein [Pseudomonadota bacterium]